MTNNGTQLQTGFQQLAAARQKHHQSLASFEHLSEVTADRSTAGIKAADTYLPEATTSTKEIANGDPFHYKVRSGEDIILNTLRLADAIKRSVLVPGSRVEMVNDCDIAAMSCEGSGGAAKENTTQSPGSTAMAQKDIEGFEWQMIPVWVATSSCTEANE